MKFKSTRNTEISYTFFDAIISGISEEGGLIIPSSLPLIDDKTKNEWKKLSYKKLCIEVLRNFIEISEINEEEMKQIIDKTFEKFTIDEIIQISPLRPFHQLKLFYGPTFAFKDIALSFLGALLEYMVEKQILKKVLLLAATSGDTGSAAIAGVRGRREVEAVVLYPRGRTSRIQELQMTAVTDDNITCISIDGTFDDCQAIVKTCLTSDLKDALHLIAANSINVARLLAQMTYFWFAALQLADKQNSVVDFVVPTGNFGNILSAYYAKQMGAPIGELVIASNSNAILTNFFIDGNYKTSEVIPTMSPSMDIQISSNFERFIFDVLQMNAALVSEKFKSLNDFHGFKITSKELSAAKEAFHAFSSSEEETRAAIEKVYREEGVVLDPHTAVGYVCAMKYKGGKEVTEQPCVVVATAHFGKFIDSIQNILEGEELESQIPKELQHLDELETKVVHLPASYEEVSLFLREKFLNKI